MIHLLDALFLVTLIEEHATALANESDQRFLDDLYDAIHDGAVRHVTDEEEEQLYRCAEEVGITWVRLWKQEVIMKHGVVPAA